MGTYRNIGYMRSRGRLMHRTSVFIVLILLIIMPGITLWAQEDQTSSDNKEKGNIINLFGRDMGHIDDKGNVTNTYGTFVGSVDAEGNIFNVSKINIGKVATDGKVLNQSGTVLGSVNDKGEIFNVSGRKMGEVLNEKEQKRIGAAARLIILK